jgi:hypothetical protein
MAEDQEAAGTGVPEKVTFTLIKSPSWRTIHADGIIGGVTPKLNITAAIYSERGALPDRTVNAVSDGQLGEEILQERVGGEGIIRELEVNMVMDLVLAKSFINWLQDKVNYIENILKQADLSSEIKAAEPTANSKQEEVH